MIAEAGGRRSYAPEAPAISARRRGGKGAGCCREPARTDPLDAKSGGSELRVPSRIRRPRSRRVVVGAVHLDNQLCVGQRKSTSKPSRGTLTSGIGNPWSAQKRRNRASGGERVRSNGR